MTRPPVDQALWQPWIDHVCSAMGVDPRLIDLGAILALAGDVAKTYARPMGPVSAHLLGLARAGGADPDEAAHALIAAAAAAAG